MADPERDNGFVYNSQGQVDIIRSPFFDLNLEIDDTIDNYVDRILFTLTLAIEEHQVSGQWRIIGHPPTSAPPATFPLSNTTSVSCLLAALFGLLIFFFR
ncbi:hypothetical protein M5K25_016106 [Dendrobium thyrsiflorum]|uniref:DOMON domain-containing protein n=1 Tax=Dendrobium thyrsiflorum TaxID=117978 RepID=A0ABD0UZJ5_DENTH